MRDGSLKKGIKSIALVRYMIDLHLTRFILKLKGEPDYILKGECCSCGSCCETPIIKTYAIIFYFKSLKWLYLTWHEKVNGFKLIRENRKERTFIFHCTHLDPESKKCDAYSSRPGMCRDYPKNIIYNTPPDFLPKCSYYPVARNADKIIESLDKLDLPPDELSELKKKFFVKKDA